MEEELNYLSENIEKLEGDISEAKMYLVGDPANEGLARFLGKEEKRFRVYSNILSALTILELNKNK
jgi:hypothetical protein